MKQIREIYKKTGKLHHAYGLWGEREEIKKELHDFLIEDLKFPVVGNPDFWQGEFNVFKVDDSRVLNESHLNKPVKYERKFFVILANFMTKDAQNSLLKIFEEPKADTIFFLIMPSVTDLIPTLKSRLIIGSQGQNTNIPEHNRPIHPLYLAEEFLSAKIGKRLTMIAKIVKDIKDEKLNKSDAISFIKKTNKLSTVLSDDVNLAMTDIVNKVISLKNKNIKILSISISSNIANGETILINGIANNRDSLTLYKEDIENDGFFEKVVFPVSNFIKNSNSEFSATLTI